MIGKLISTIEISEGIESIANGNDVSFKANGKENARHFKSINIVLKKIDSKIEVRSKTERKNVIAEGRTIAAHLKNMILGLQKDYICKLEIVYSHFPMTVTVKDNLIEINNLAGAKQMRKSKILPNVKVEVKGKNVTVTGHNKESVGQTSANMEMATKIKGKDVRVYTDGIYITAKAAIPTGEWKWQNKKKQKLKKKKLKPK